MKTCVSEEMIVPALASTVIAEIEAQATHMMEQEIEISRRGTVISGLERENASIGDELAMVYDILDSLKMRQKVTGIMENNGMVPRK